MTETMEKSISKVLDNVEKGLDFGIKSLNILLGGIQRETIYSIGASPKVGKTTFVDYSFLLSPYLNDVLKLGKKVKWIYFSFEISRERKMFKLAPFFFALDFKKTSFTHKGQNHPINSTYLSNKMLDEDEELIKIKDDDREIFNKIYHTRLVPLFGKKENGKYIRKGVVDVIEQATNPTGLRNYLLDFASKNGTFMKEPYNVIENGLSKTKYRITGYTPNDEDEQVIIITDHVRKLYGERGFQMKQIIDTWVKYQVELRNWCKYSFVDIAHLNRNLDNIDRMRFAKDKIYPTGADFKDSGNLSEESDVVMTLFDPRDDKFKLTSHFGHDLRKYPGYRSLHIVDSRDSETGNIFTIMDPNLNIFKQLIE